MLARIKCGAFTPCQALYFVLLAAVLTMDQTDNGLKARHDGSRDESAHKPNDARFRSFFWPYFLERMF